MRTVPLKLITIVAEAVLEGRLAGDIVACGASGYTVTDAQVAALLTNGTNNNFAFTPTLASLYINGSAETAVPAFNASTLNAFFMATSYIGAVRDANDTWYAGWTCNSATANFGAASGSCTSLPTI